MSTHTPILARSARGGFTLIELLAAISIIGLLAALLFPVFAKAREKARQTTCLSNLRQLGQAFNLYAQDYDQRLPEQWAGGPSDDIVTITLNRAWETHLRPYIKNAGINHCPSDMLSIPTKIPGTSITLFSSYATAWNVQGKSLATVPASALTVLLVENKQNGGLGEVDWLVQQLGKRSFTLDEGITYEQPAFFHNEMGNYLFVDTHVKALRGPNPSFAGYKTNSVGSARCGSADPLPQ